MSALSVPWALRPGGGFLWLVAILLASAAFFAWGLRTPRLEELLVLQHQLERGEAISARGLRQLQTALGESPELAEDLLEAEPARFFGPLEGGRVDGRRVYWILRETAALEIEISPVSDATHVVHVRDAHGPVHQGSTTTARPFRWSPPRDGPFPRLLEVEIEGAEAFQLSTRQVPR
jgi:hypothetical protein